MNNGVRSGLWGMMVAAGLAVVAVAAPVAWAQGGNAPREGERRGGGRQGGGMMRGLMGGQWAQPPALREADLRGAMQDVLADTPLSDEQQQAVAALVRAYDERVGANEQKVRDARRAAMEKFRESRDSSVWEQVRTQQQAGAAEQRAMEATLLSDVRTVLTPEQGQSWDAIEAGVMRSRSLRRGLLSGERVSLRGVLREVAQANGAGTEAGVMTQELKDTLAAYEAQLDGVLRARDALLNESAALTDAVRSGDIAEATKQLEQREAAARAVAQVNDRFAGSVRALLAEGTREAFDAQLTRSRYPEAYRKSGIQEALDGALDLHDLTDDQRTQLAGIVERFDARYAGFRAKAIAARADAEANMKVSDVVARFTGGGGGNDRWSAAEAVFEERRGIDRELRAELAAVLNEEQAKIVLPAPGERGGGGEGGGRGRMRQRENPPV
jgi:hypothetical protein